MKRRIQRVVDCHAHLIDPDRYPLPAGGGYRPSPDEAGPLEAFCATLDRHGVGHALLVQLSGYGFDNSILLDAMAAHPGRFRAIAVVAAETGEADLERLAAAGVVGLRFNLVSYERDQLFRPETARLLARMKELGWFAQVYADDDQWADAARLLRASGVKVLVDHFGLRDPAAVGGVGFAAVLGLGRDGIATVKLSAPFRVSARPDDYADLAPVYERLLRELGPRSLIWGSDWPFPAVRPRPDYGDVLAFVSRWLGSGEERDIVLWRTPARLFGLTEEARP